MPTYAVIIALWGSRLAYSPVVIRWHVTMIVAIITCLVPLCAIISLKRLGIISDPGLNNRTERPIPYLVTGLAYVACAFYLWRANAPSWLWLFMVGATVATAISVIVNTRWKISAHMAAAGGVVAMIFRMIELGVGVGSSTLLCLASIAVLAAGLVGTARIYLDRHTLMQVIVGTANGFLCVYLISML